MSDHTSFIKEAYIILLCGIIFQIQKYIKIKTQTEKVRTRS